MKIVIFSGGAGTRMWPLSRISLPKQFQSLVGEKSMFAQMVDLVQLGFKSEDIFVLTGKDYIDIVAKQTPKIPRENIIGEPEMRDTLAAVGFASAFLNKKFPGETMAALWGADHIVKNKEMFIKALGAAEKLAKEENKIVKVDVHPTFPSVHLGYVQIGEKLKTFEGFEVFQFIRHVEKPDFETAKNFLESGKYLWNTGYFVWNLSKIMELFKKYTPEVFANLHTIQSSLGTKSEERTIAAEYQKIPQQMIDHALFEKLSSEDQIEITANLGWTDVGAWNVLKEELAKNGMKNVVRGSHIDVDTKDCLIFGPEEGKLIATIGLEGMIIVDTPDALLVCPKDRSQDVRKVVSQIKEAKKHEYL